MSRLAAKLVTLSFVAAILTGAPLAAYADERLRTAQEILAREGLYYGAVDGVSSEETTVAVRIFQRLNNLPITGALDEQTWAALSQRPAPPGGAEPVTSARERARTTAEADSEFLRQYEMEQSTPAPAPAAPAAVPAAPAREAISLEEVDRFITDYLNAAERPTPHDEVAFYADQISYFGSGTVTRDYVQRDQERYYSRWPLREFTLLESPKVVAADANGALVTFRIHYRVQNAKQAAEGQTENVMRLERSPQGFRIVSIHERKMGK